MFDRNLLDSHLYGTFVLSPLTEQKDTIHAIKAEVLHKVIIITKIQTHKTDIALHTETNSVMTKKLLLHNTLDHDTTTTKEIHDHTALLTDLLTDSRKDMTLLIDIVHNRVHEITTILQDTHRPIDHLQDQEIPDVPDHVHIQTQEINLIQYNHNTKQTQSNLKYTCIIQLKWQLLLHLQVGSILYTYKHHQIKFTVKTHPD